MLAKVKLNLTIKCCYDMPLCKKTSAQFYRKRTNKEREMKKLINKQIKRNEYFNENRR